jgi:hypothetical protein
MKFTAAALPPSPLSIFIFAIILLSPVAARADHLYEVNLLNKGIFSKQTESDSATRLNSTIKQLKADMKLEPARKSDFQFEIASAEARQGQLTKALSDLNKIKDKNLAIRSDYLEERAEIKSLLGLHAEALLDINNILSQASGEWQTWQTLWHKSIILERAGKTNESELCLRAAKANLDRFQTNSIFEQTFSQIIIERHLTAIEPAPKQAKTAIALIQKLLHQPTCPQLSNTIELLGFSAQPEKNGQTSEDKYLPLSSQSPFRYATINPDGNQIRLFLDTTNCLITPEELKKNFDVGTDKELWPDGMSGCGPSTMALYPRKKSSAMFLFDGAKKPGLCMFFIAYHPQNSQ